MPASMYGPILAPTAIDAGNMHKSVIALSHPYSGCIVDRTIVTLPPGSHSLLNFLIRQSGSVVVMQISSGVSHVLAILIVTYNALISVLITLISRLSVPICGSAWHMYM